MLPFLAPLAYTAGRALYNKLAGNRGGGLGDGSAEEQRYRSLFDSAMGRYGQQGDALTNEYLNNLRGFDARDPWSEQTKAELADYDTNFARTYGDRVGQMVGTGRGPMRSGYGLRDVNNLVLQGQRERAGIVQRNAGEAANAYLAQQDRIGSVGQGMQNRFFDAASGRLDTLEAQRLQNAASKRGMWGSLAGAAIGAAGNYYGARRAGA